MDVKIYRSGKAPFEGPRALSANISHLWYKNCPALVLDVYRDGLPHRTVRASEPSLGLSMAALVTLNLGRFRSFERRR